MKRRDFLWQAGTATMALMFPYPRTLRSEENAGGDKPPFVISIRASGGWDPTFLCDPVIGNGRFTPWNESHVGTAGPITYAPYQVEGNSGLVYEGAGGDFFQKHWQKAVIVNGVDCETVSHEVGGKVALAGTSRDGYPTFSGLVGGMYGKGLPFAYLVGGGYATAQGLVPVTRTGGKRILEHVIFPNSQRRRDSEIHHHSVRTLVSQYRRERDQRLANGGTGLPREQASYIAVAASRQESIEQKFEGFRETMDDAIGRDIDNDVAEGAEVILKAMRRDLCAAGHLSAGSARFDTHSGHDSLNPLDGHRPQLDELLRGVDWILDTAEADPVISQRGLVVLVVSEFGRTEYNDANGKDHWPITSMMAFAVGRAQSMIRCGRVVGGTTIEGSENSRGVLARRVKVNAAQDGLDLLGPRDESGFSLLSGHVHVALRDALGLKDDHIPSRPLTQFALPSIPQKPLPIF